MEHKNKTVLADKKSDEHAEKAFEDKVLRVLAKRMEKSPHRTRDNHHMFTMSPSEVHQILNPVEQSTEVNEIDG